MEIKKGKKRVRKKGKEKKLNNMNRLEIRVIMKMQKIKKKKWNFMTICFLGSGELKQKNLRGKSRYN